MKLRRADAFTLIELLITTSVGTILGGIIYLVASEGVVSFARNTSINRAYTEARTTINRIASNIESAGQSPILVDATGTAQYTAAQAQGVRFYRYNALPSYQIPSGTTASSSLTFNFTQYQAGGTPAGLVGIGDLVTIPLIGFQDTVTSIGGITTNGDGSGSITVNFAAPMDTLGKCSPALPTSGSPAKTVDTNFALVHKNTATTPVTPALYYSCMVFRQVAYIAVPTLDANSNVIGAQLRYYPQAMSTGVGANSAPTTWACGGLTAFNNAAAFNNPANYKVISNLFTGTVVVPTGTPAVNAQQPFQLVKSSTVTTLGITICEQGPDYSNRATASFNTVSYANSVSLMRCTASSRCPNNLVR